ncbi:MAG: hypothetical protein JW720_06315 [Sedimentisphaerales bacterium]|nr:hypothetical protein [Sedimentisphaerales bacterium]
MPKPKRRSGLQKNFSDIFDGVWIPPKPNDDKAEQSAAQRPSQSPLPQGQPQDQAQPQSQPQDQAQPQSEQQQAQAAEASSENPPLTPPQLDLPQHLSEPAEPMPVEQPQHVEEPGAAEQNPPIEQIRRIISNMKCSKGFECYKSGFKRLCKIRNVNDGKVIECSPENTFPCEFRFEFMSKRFCKCQLRHFIARTLKK